MTGGSAAFVRKRARGKEGGGAAVALDVDGEVDASGI